MSLKLEKVKDMHLLDFIMFFILGAAIWSFMDMAFDGEITQELGGLIGLMVMFVYGITYIVLFCFWPDWNWCDFNLNGIDSCFKL